MDKTTSGSIAEKKYLAGPVKILAHVYLALLILAMIILGPSPLLYFLFVLLAAWFILPDQPLFSLSLIIVLTMIFERHFALQGLAIDQIIYKFYLLDAVICLSWLALLIDHKRHKKNQRLISGWPEKILLFWLALVGLNLIRSLFDINADLAVAFSSFKNYFFYPLLYFFVILVVDSGKKLKDIVHLILLAAVGLIAFIFIGLARGQGLWTEFTPLSTAGTRYLAGTHAFYLALAIALGWPLLLYQRLKNKSFALAIAGFWTLGIAVSLMRHLWLALAFALAATLLLLNRELKKIYLAVTAQAGLIIAASLAALILTASLLYFQGSLDKIYGDLNALSARIATVADLSADASIAWRQDVWQGAIKIWAADPLFGVGFGHAMLTEVDSFPSSAEIRNIHNSPLAIAVQTGVIGLAAFLSFVLSVLIVAGKKIRADEDLQPYYLGLLAAIFVFLVASLFQPYLETNLMAIWLWLLLGLFRTASLKKT